MQAANVGDSAAFFTPFPKRRSAPPEVVPLTADHRVANPDERQRLEGARCLRLLRACDSLPSSSHWPRTQPGASSACPFKEGEPPG